MRLSSMKHILLLLSFLCWAVPGWASYSPLGSTCSTGVTGSQNTTGATFIAASVTADTGTLPSSLTDSKGNTWARLTISTSATVDTVLYVVASPTVGSGHTFTPPQSYDGICVAWYTGQAASPTDQQNHGITSGTSISTGPVTPSEDNELLLAAWGSDASNTTSMMAVDSGFTLLGTVEAVPAVTYGVALAELIENMATSKNPGFSWSGVVNANAVIATFKAASAVTSGGRELLLGVH